MQLTELLFQRVKDLGAQGQLSLRPGYVAVVSKAGALRSVLMAALFPGPDDQRRLADSSGPTRVGLGLLAGDGTPYRLLRELGSARQLLRFDPGQKKFGLISQDNLEIESFLRVECGLPPADHYASFFLVEANELPSLRGKAPAGVELVVDQVKVKQLKDELEETKKYEVTQDRLFKVQQRLHELTTLTDKVKAAENELASLDAELARSPWKPEEMQDLAARAARAKDERQKMETALSEIAMRRQHAIRTTPPPPEPFLKSAWFLGGVAGGLGLDGLAYFLKHPGIALLGLLPYAAALVAVLRWIHDDEADKEAAQFVKELKEREDAARKAYAEDQAVLRNALRAANADTTSELLDLFREREAVMKKRDAAREKLAKLKQEPDLAKAPIELPLLREEKARLEQAVSAQGFARPLGEIELDLKHALGLGETRRGGVAIPDPEVPKHLVAQAAELLAMAPDHLWESLAARLPAYLSALTDRRVVGAKPDAKGFLVLSAADGRQGPYQGLPRQLKDLSYAALRLALLERVAGYKKLPIVIDDAFAALDAGKRALVAKMLKGIAAQTQIIHRSADAPPQGIADHVVQA